MSIYDEYQIVINEGQRKVIMRALTNAMANDRLSTSRGGTLSRPTQDEYMQLVRLFGTIKPAEGTAAILKGGLITTHRLKLALTQPSAAPLGVVRRRLPTHTDAKR